MPAVRFQPRKARKPMLKSSPQNARAVSLNLWPLGFTCPAGHDAEALSNLGAMAKARFGMRKALGDCQTILQVFSLSPSLFPLEPLLAHKSRCFSFSHQLSLLSSVESNVCRIKTHFFLFASTGDIKTPEPTFPGTKLRPQVKVFTEVLIHRPEFLSLSQRYRKTHPRSRCRRRASKAQGKRSRPLH
jgi:hypothetical protein